MRTMRLPQPAPAVRASHRRRIAGRCSVCVRPSHSLAHGTSGSSNTQPRTAAAAPSAAAPASRPSPASSTTRRAAAFPQSSLVATSASISDSASTSASTSSSGPTAPPLPGQLHAQLASARASWRRQCVDSPLRDPATNSRVHLYGTVHFAPYGGGRGLAELQQLVAEVRPTVLAIEQPFDLAARAGLPYPELIRQLTELLPPGGQLLTSPLAGPRDGDGDGDAEAAEEEEGTVAAREAEVAEAVQGLRALLPGLAQPARVGRDLLDPFEVLGLYSGCDYVTRPGQLAEALALFGFLPGLEYAALAQAADDQGVQVYSVDAPLRLQETWVSQLAADFKLSEQDLSRRLQHDLQRTAALLPPSYHTWDVAVAAAVRQQQQQQQQAGGAAAEAETGPPASTITAFKVSRAVAAAVLPYAASRDAFALQASLQPLKYALFARRARHLVLQVRDLCQRMSVQQVRVDSGSLKSSEAGTAGGGGGGGGGAAGGQKQQQQQQLQQQAGFELVEVAGQPAQVVLAVVGRQYVHAIQEMWANERSALWHGDVPRTFAPSQLDR